MFRVIFLHSYLRIRKRMKKYIRHFRSVELFLLFHTQLFFSSFFFARCPNFSLTKKNKQPPHPHPKNSYAFISLKLKFIKKTYHATLRTSKHMLQLQEHTHTQTQTYGACGCTHTHTQRQTHTHTQTYGACGWTVNLDFHHFTLNDLCLLPVVIRNSSLTVLFCKIY